MAAKLRNSKLSKENNYSKRWRFDFKNKTIFAQKINIAIKCIK